MASPLKIGMYHFARMMTSKSTPVVVTITPGHVEVVSTDGPVFQAPLDQVSLKHSRTTGALTLSAPSGKTILAAVGSAKGAAFSAQQEQEVQQAQAAAAQDPSAATLELSQLVWVGKPGSVDGSYGGGMRSLAAGEAPDQRRVGGIVRDALVAAGARAD